MEEKIDSHSKSLVGLKEWMIEMEKIVECVDKMV